MTKRKTVKRQIRFACTELWAECVAVSLYVSEANKHNMEATLHSIVKLQEDYLSRVSHVEPGIRAKAYFKDLAEKFNGHATEISDQVNNLY